ncbi:MAG: hypothetical protein U0Z44_03325 [Kouleothrix sp.]
MRQRWLADPAPYEALFGQVRWWPPRAPAWRTASSRAGGCLLNHALLQQIGVSSPELRLL